jgi:hypothetical protein
VDIVHPQITIPVEQSKGIIQIAAVRLNLSDKQRQSIRVVVEQPLLRLIRLAAAGRSKGAPKDGAPLLPSPINP